MKITVKQLKRLVMEAVEETLADAGVAGSGPSRDKIEAEKQKVVSKWKTMGDREDAMPKWEFAMHLYAMGTNNHGVIGREHLGSIRQKYYAGWSNDDLVEVALAIDPEAAENTR